MPISRPNVFVGHLGDYEVIETEDQSITLKSLKFDEACHSLSGAYAETLHNYLMPCKVEQKARLQEELIILEVGFGLGVGVQATFQSLQQIAPIKAAVHYIALELDEGLIDFASEHIAIEAPDFPQISELKKTLSRGINTFESQKGAHRLTLLMGDARTTLLQAYQQDLFAKVDVIYQDAFSPKKNTELWTQEWFETLFKVSHEKTVMSTYCSSLSPRKAMHAAGWALDSFKGLGKKRECTIAYRSGESAQALKTQLEKSQAIILTDEKIDQYRQK